MVPIFTGPDLYASVEEEEWEVINEDSMSVCSCKTCTTNSVRSWVVEDSCGNLPQEPETDEEATFVPDEEGMFSQPEADKEVTQPLQENDTEEDTELSEVVAFEEVIESTQVPLAVNDVAQIPEVQPRELLNYLFEDLAQQRVVNGGQNFYIGTPPSSESGEFGTPRSMVSAPPMPPPDAPHPLLPPWMQVRRSFPCGWIFVDTGFLASPLRVDLGAPLNETFSHVINDMRQIVGGPDVLNVLRPQDIREGTLHKVVIQGTRVGNLTLMMLNTPPITKNTVYRVTCAVGPRICIQGLKRKYEDLTDTIAMLRILRERYGR